jgi:uncharacterized protein
MLRVVIDTTVLVSALLKFVPGGVSHDLLEFAAQRKFELVLSNDILEEAARVLLTNERNRRRYRYSDAEIVGFCKELARIGTVIEDVPEVTGVVRDLNDDKIIACAIAAGAEYLVTRDKDLLSLGEYERIVMIKPEAFLHMLRAQM